MPTGCSASGSCWTWSSHPATSPAGCSDVGPASTSHLARPGRLPDMGAGTQTGLERVDRLDWSALTEEEDAYGHAQTAKLLSPAECASISALSDDVERCRSTMDMGRYRFGSGQYRYFDHPLPDLVAQLREAFYPHLLPIAREWAEKLGRPAPWPDTFAEWLDDCHRAGQNRPTPILLRYQAGDWNALHRDLYGELVFPLQVVIGLDRPGVDHEGGEFLLVEQRPRAQSRGTAT